MFYGYAEVEKIARRIWRGSYPKNSDGEKWCDAKEVGINLTQDFLHGLKFGEWERVSDKLEMKMGGTLIFGGRLFVRKIQ